MLLITISPCQLMPRMVVRSLLTNEKYSWFLWRELLSFMNRSKTTRFWFKLLPGLWDLKPICSLLPQNFSFLPRGGQFRRSRCFLLLAHLLCRTRTYQLYSLKGGALSMYISYIFVNLCYHLNISSRSPRFTVARRDARTTWQMDILVMIAVVNCPPGAALWEALVTRQGARHVIQYNPQLVLYGPIGPSVPTGSTLVSHRPTYQQRCFSAKIIVTYCSVLEVSRF